MSTYIALPEIISGLLGRILFSSIFFRLYFYALIGNSRLFIIADDAFDRTGLENRALKTTDCQRNWTYNHDIPPQFSGESLKLRYNNLPAVTIIYQP
jgi:hypothetical protein